MNTPNKAAAGGEGIAHKLYNKAQGHAETQL